MNYTIDCQQRLDGHTTCVVGVPDQLELSIFAKATLGDWSTMGILITSTVTAVIVLRQWVKDNTYASVKIGSGFQIVQPGKGIIDSGPLFSIETTNLSQKELGVVGHYVQWFKTPFHKLLNRPMYSAALVDRRPSATLPPGRKYQFLENVGNLLTTNQTCLMYIGSSHTLSRGRLQCVRYSRSTDKWFTTYVRSWFNKSIYPSPADAFDRPPDTDSRQDAQV